MAAWLGGLGALLVLLPAATRRLAGGERTQLLAAVLLRFSPLALACVVALVITGTVQGLLHLDGLQHLVDDAYGRLLLAKLALLTLLVGLGAVNRRRLLPRLRAAAGRVTRPARTGACCRRPARGGRPGRHRARRHERAGHAAAPEHGSRRPADGRAPPRPAGPDADARPRAPPSQRAAPLPLPRPRRRALRGDARADAARGTARARHRADRRDAARGRPRPLPRRTRSRCSPRATGAWTSSSASASSTSSRPRRGWRCADVSAALLTGLRAGCPPSPAPAVDPRRLSRHRTQSQRREDLDHHADPNQARRPRGGRRPCEPGPAGVAQAHTVYPTEGTTRLQLSSGAAQALRGLASAPPAPASGHRRRTRSTR